MVKSVIMGDDSMNLIKKVENTKNQFIVLSDKGQEIIIVVQEDQEPDELEDSN